MVVIWRENLKAMQDDRRILMNKGINVYLRELEKEESLLWRIVIMTGWKIYGNVN